MTALNSRKISFVFFTFFLTFCLAVNSFLPDKSYSDTERRYLAQKPELKLRSLTSGKYTSEMESYFTDQFISRDKWVGAKSIIEYFIGKGITNGVYFAEDRYLIESFSSYDDVRLERNINHISVFTERMNRKKIKTNTMIVPTASSVMSDRLPPNAPETDQHRLFDKISESVTGFIDASDELSAHADEYIYYRNDHHWTSLGAFYAYDTYRKALGENSVESDRYIKTILSRDFLGTTYYKSNFMLNKPDTIIAYEPYDVNIFEIVYNFSMTSDSIYEMSYIDSNDEYSVFLNGNQSFTKIKTDNKNGKRLLLIKDSYANTFAQLCIADYEEIYLADLRYFRTSPDEQISELDITEILVLYNIKNFCESDELIFLN